MKQESAGNLLKKKRNERRFIEPEKIIIRDQKLLRAVIEKWNQMKATAESQISKMQHILELVTHALHFIKTLDAAALTELKDPLAWRRYEELSYVFAMNELF